MENAALYLYELKSSNSRATLTKMHKGELACGKYGGCAYQKICNRQLTIEQHTKLLTQQKEDTNMSALAKLRANKAGKKDEPKQEAPNVSEAVETPKEETKPVEKKETQSKAPSPETKTNKDKVDQVEKEERSSNPCKKAVPADGTKTDFALFINCRPTLGFKPSKSIQVLLRQIKEQTKLTGSIWDRCNFYEANIDMICKQLEGENIIASNYSTEAGHLLDLLIARAKVVVEG
jgi:hypothetical protein